MLATNLPAVQVKILSGADNVDFWSEKRIWDAALLNVRVVISTPAILFDALSHGFVSLSTISLLILDEGKNAFYHLYVHFCSSISTSVYFVCGNVNDSRDPSEAVRFLCLVV